MYQQVMTACVVIGRADCKITTCAYNIRLNTQSQCQYAPFGRYQSVLYIVCENSLQTENSLRSRSETDVSLTDTAGGGLLVDVIITSVLEVMAHPHGENTFAVEFGRTTVDQYYAKRISVVDVEAVQSLQQVRGSVNCSHCPRKRKTRSLQNVIDSISITARILCLVESAARVSRHVVQTVFANFMQHPLPAGENEKGATKKGLEPRRELLEMETFISQL